MNFAANIDVNIDDRRRPSRATIDKPFSIIICINPGQAGVLSSRYGVLVFRVTQVPDYLHCYHPRRKFPLGPIEWDQWDPIGSHSMGPMQWDPMGLFWNLGQIPLGPIDISHWQNPLAKPIGSH